MNKYEKMYVWVVTGLLILFVIGYCNQKPKPITHEEDPRIAILQSERDSLESVIKKSDQRVDTIYLEKAVIKKRTTEKVAKVKELRPTEKDSLFTELYPTKDSAIATFYWCEEAREQEAKSQEIITEKDIQLAAKDSTILLSDSTASIYKKERDTERKKNQDNAYSLYLWKSVSKALIAVDAFVILAVIALK